MRAFLAAAAVAALTVGCNQSQNRATGSGQSIADDDTAAALAGIDSLIDRFVAAANRDDAAAVAATYSDSSLGIGDGEIMDSAETAMEAVWKEQLPYLSDMKINTVRRSARGDLGVVLFQGTQRVTPAKGQGEPHTDSIWALSEVRRGKDGQWRWHTWVVSGRPH
jgi:ketosteroid isomerase-like protein